MKKSRYGNANGFFVCISVMIIMLSNALCSPLLTEIAADVGTDIALAGYLPTVTTLFMGVSLMASTTVVKRMGLRHTMALAMFLVTLGNVSAFWAESFFILLFGRALVGIGMGTLGTGFSLVAVTWFHGKKQSAFVTIYTLGNSLATYIGFLAAIPLFRSMGRSWRACYMLVGCLSAVLVAGWLIWGTDIPQQQLNSNPCRNAKTSGGLFRTITNKDIWILTVYHSLATLCTNVITNYLPSYLQVVRNCEAEQAASWSGIISLAGIIGTMIGGFLSTATGRRRPVVISGTVLSLLSMAGLIIFKQPLAIVTCIALFGFAARYRIPATTSVSAEIKKNDPSFSAAAYALMYGVGSVIGIAAPPILSVTTKMFGMQQAMLYFTGCLAVASFFSFFVKETGPKANLN